jgi:phage terminase large subunit-like protein
MIPAQDIIEVKASTGIPGAVDHVRVRHTSGNESVLYMKSYEQQREKWQGESLNWIWFDEEPPRDIYSEGLTRLTATRGIAFVTFTPLLGQSDVVLRFLRDRPVGTSVTTMTIEDAGHYTAEQRAEIIARYPPHEREARARGIPMMGSGRVFPVAEETIVIEAFPLPAHWPRIVGIDFGYEHPTACAWLAWDRDTDTIYVYDTYRAAEMTPPLHAAAIRAKGSWIPVSWPHDGNADTAAGPQLAKQYRDCGVLMRPENAKFPLDARAPAISRISVEAGIAEMLTRMQTGRWKVFKHLEQWLDEFRLYHRKDGHLVKIRDDTISASRYALMDIRFAKTSAPARPRAARTKPLDPVMGY